MLFASIVVTGVKMVAELGFTPKNVLILTIALGVGYGFSLIPNFYSKLGPIAENILSNPVAMIFILSLILSFAIPEKWGTSKAKKESIVDDPPKEEIKNVDSVPTIEKKEPESIEENKK